MLSNLLIYPIPGRGPCRRRGAGAIAMICLLLTALMTGGCIRNEFNVTFALPADVNSTYRLAYYASNSSGGLNIESAAAVAAGKGAIKGVTRYPTLVSIYYGSSAMPAAVFYAERGDKIEITGPGADPGEWKISGNKINEELTAWRLSHRKEISAAGIASAGNSDATARRSLNALISDYVKASPESAAAVLILYSYFDARLEPEKFRSLWGLVSGSDGFDKLDRLLARQDLNSAGFADTPAAMKLPDVVVQSADNNADTLRFASADRPVLLYYWRRNDPDRSPIMDSLKRVARWRPDSVSMPMADVALTSDSAQWVSEIRRDSLLHTIRAFSPRGLADPQAMRLNVRATPWFVVGSGKGKCAYAGSDAKEALRIFRSLRPKAKKTAPADSVRKNNTKSGSGR